MQTNVTVVGNTIAESEVKNYIQYVNQKNPGRAISSLRIEPDGGYVNLSYELEPVPFERIRRITGYLVGTMDRWNDAKRAEERDRVKHGI
ncbi:hypothetical protein EQM14_05265 [Caproiciproducens sp. NJN-50]|uniref:anaerobic ribonucleoside-triphosphate reductase n=1 Tax=Acutalibacteraceae TaxID=3082771 RepID=UPI000FFE1980|nr:MULTISPECIES: anaerobic ribonucleoside-triphosphate reductase [Acutalibacteraceae]QAT49234.1 hypothetical protein EQM14_05265 [Caproiciproducens sp. NJN-50]